MDDADLRRAVVRLYALDDGSDPITQQRELDPDAAELRVRCGQALWERLSDEQGDLRLWLSRLVRDVFLSEAALARGLGVEDACDFWSWFDKTMWREAVLRAPAVTGRTAGRPALRSVPPGGTGPASSPPSPDTPAAAPTPAPAVAAGAAVRSLRSGRVVRQLEPTAGSTR